MMPVLIFSLIIAIEVIIITILEVLVPIVVMGVSNFIVKILINRFILISNLFVILLLLHLRSKLSRILVKIYCRLMFLPHLLLILLILLSPVPIIVMVVHIARLHVVVLLIIRLNLI